jgi:hypothetical protein
VGVDWIHVPHDRDWWQAVVNTNEHSDSIKGREFHDQLNDVSDFEGVLGVVWLK